MIDVTLSIIGVMMWFSGALFWVEHSDYAVAIYLLLTFLIVLRLEKNIKK